LLSVNASKNSSPAMNWSLRFTASFQWPSRVLADLHLVSFLRQLFDGGIGVARGWPH
jgi:hypothetical protein